jgi:hypothetical protein
MYIKHWTGRAADGCGERFAVNERPDQDVLVMWSWSSSQLQMWIQGKKVTGSA